MAKGRHCGQILSSASLEEDFKSSQLKHHVRVKPRWLEICDTVLTAVSYTHLRAHETEADL
eukprot:4364926-Amphidinium_carterae.1